MAKNLKTIEHDELGGMRPEVIAKQVFRQLRKKNMSVRVIPRADYKLVGFLVRMVPARVKLSIIRILY